HEPTIYDSALKRSGWLLDLEHLTYFLAGVLMWWPVAHGRYSDGVKALYLFPAFVLAAPLGLLLALLPPPRLWVSCSHFSAVRSTTSTKPRRNSGVCPIRRTRRSPA